MASFVLTVVIALVVAAAGFVIVAFTLGRTNGFVESTADGVPGVLPDDRALTSSDVTRIRFDMALRGYRMAQVDSVLRRLSYELADANARVAELELALHRQRAQAQPENPDAAESDPHE